MNAELERIKKHINNLSMEEFEEVLYNCGIERIKPSIESSYVQCMKSDFQGYEYRKAFIQYNMCEEYFEFELLEVA